MAFPVVDARGRMKGIVTLDDIVDVVREEATEDIQKIGGTAAFDEPYLRLGVLDMVKKRAGWLRPLPRREPDGDRDGLLRAGDRQAVVLALFVPLVISSGGNSGGQATTLVIRAMSLGEVKLRDWWRVMEREVLSGLALGAILAAIGVVRILAWQAIFHTYGESPRAGRGDGGGGAAGGGALGDAGRVDAAVRDFGGLASTPRARPRRSWRRSSTSPGS